ncbi:MAG: hypothetical protein Edafosvirus1_63 [Edafosvirus sp.]|uniref:Right handed beta helix domain-containing protein n=1 Tax=Edafosvirus sp. TaxID=2487765 RepID=A0A3G4ZS37_9VIRU|nr:MAG: hypothetical protein Edafosvirus1_63 [Edafosvirus sp.]
MKLLLLLLSIYSIAHATYSPYVDIGQNNYVFGKNLELTGGETYNGIYNITEEINNITDILQLALYTIGANGGGTLLVKKGTYILTRNLNMGANTHFKGEGMGITNLTLVDFAEPFAKAGFVRTSLMNNVIISNMSLNGNKLNQYNDQAHHYGRYGIFTEASQYVWFDHVHITNFQGYGFDPHGNKDDKLNPIYGKNLTITNCIANDNDWDGFTLDQSIDIVATNNLAYHNGRHGFNIVTGSYQVVIANNSANDNGYFYPSSFGCGISIQNNQDIYITRLIWIYNNNFKNNARAGICLNDVPYTYIYNNYISASCVCFDFSNAQYVYAHDNVCATRSLYKSDTSSKVFIDINPQNQSAIYLNNNAFIFTSTCSSLVPETVTNNNYIVGYNIKSPYNIIEISDTTKIIQSALNDIYSNGGGTVLIKAGTYIINETLKLQDMTHLQGEGIDETILILKNYSRPFVAGTAGFLRGRLLNDITISNMTIDGNKNNQYSTNTYLYGRSGIFMEACKNTKIYNIKSINFQQTGIDIHGWNNGNIWGINGIVDNCIINNNLRYGITTDQMINVSITNSIAFDNGGHGIFINNTQYFTGGSNIVKSNGYTSTGCGYMLSYSSLFPVETKFVYDNTIANNKKAGVCINNVKNANINSNTFNNSCICFNFVSFENILVEENVCKGTKEILSVPTFNISNDNLYEQQPCSTGLAYMVTDGDHDLKYEIETLSISAGKQTYGNIFFVSILSIIHLLINKT